MEAPFIYRALVFGAICGLKRIVDGFEEARIEIERIVAVGGISKKSDYIMQMMADVLRKKIAILDADQTCALGAAIYGAMAGGIYQDVETALEHMSAKCVKEYLPEDTDKYHRHYEEYLRLAGLADQWD